MKPSTFNLQSFGSKDLVQTPADSKVNAKAVITLAGRRMRCIQCLKISCGVSVSGSATAFSFTWATKPDSGTAITLPLRMVQASATAAAEQPCAAPTRVSVGSLKRRIFVCAEDWPLACLAWTQCGLAKCELSLARKRASHVVT